MTELYSCKTFGSFLSFLTCPFIQGSFTEYLFLLKQLLTAIFTLKMRDLLKTKAGTSYVNNELAKKLKIVF